MNRKAVISATALALVGCLTGRSRGHALYPPTNPPPQPNEVATLTGYVERVDGQDVSDYGKSFELIPGCHLIETPKEWGAFTNVGNVVVKTGHLLFALPMKAAHQYVVAVRTGQMTGPTATAVIEALEKDLESNTTNVFAPARSHEDIEACRQWESQLKPSDKISSPPPDNGVSDAGAGE